MPLAGLSCECIRHCRRMGVFLSLSLKNKKFQIRTTAQVCKWYKTAKVTNLRYVFSKRFNTMQYRAQRRIVSFALLNKQQRSNPHSHPIPIQIFLHPLQNIPFLYNKFLPRHPFIQIHIPLSKHDPCIISNFGFWLVILEALFA